MQVYYLRKFVSMPSGDVTYVPLPSKGRLVPVPPQTPLHLIPFGCEESAVRYLSKHKEREAAQKK
jgi:hypothetical protein